MSGKAELYNSLERILARLYVLRNSCTGIIHTDKSNPNLVWFQGAEAILQEAVHKLQEALGALEGMISMAEKEGKDWAQVENLIRKLDKSYLWSLGEKSGAETPL